MVLPSAKGPNKPKMEFLVPLGALSQARVQNRSKNEPPEITFGPFFQTPFELTRMQQASCLEACTNRPRAGAHFWNQFRLYRDYYYEAATAPAQEHISGVSCAYPGTIIMRQQPPLSWSPGVGAQRDQIGPSTACEADCSRACDPGRVSWKTSCQLNL